MPRDLIVSNGHLMVLFDSNYNIRDIYYPHVGLENHVIGHPFHFGVWVDGRISWVGEEWKRQLRYARDSLVTEVTLENDHLKLKLLCNDLVDFATNAYFRRVKILNLSDKSRQIRLFFHQDFSIFGSEVGDTVFFDAKTQSIIHYKGNRYFLIDAMGEKEKHIAHYATGQKRFRGLEGTWRDADDGVLSNNPIAQGSVDSIIGVHVDALAQSSETIFYWIIAGKKYHAVADKTLYIHGKGPNNFVERNIYFWNVWANKEQRDFSDLPDRLIELYKRSLLLISAHLNHNGAIIASADSDILEYARDTYSYVWPRDGAFTAMALDEAGYPEESRKFFNFCTKLLVHEGYFLHKYNPDGSFASSWHPWIQGDRPQLPIQEDETGTVIHALWLHFQRYRDLDFIKPLYRKLIKNAADFMVDYQDDQTGLPQPSYDIWEERRGIWTFATSATIAGLLAASKFTELFGERTISQRYANRALTMKEALLKHLFDEGEGRFLRGLLTEGGTNLPDKTVDSSIYAPLLFGLLPASDPRMATTMRAIEEGLSVKLGVGGVARYENDHYYQSSKDVGEIPGNPWILSTLWVANWHLMKATTSDELGRGLRALSWVADRARPSGMLPEQVNPRDGAPLSVSPLAWSHVAYVHTVHLYLEAAKRLADKLPKPTFT